MDKADRDRLRAQAEPATAWQWSPRIASQTILALLDALDAAERASDAPPCHACGATMLPARVAEWRCWDTINGKRAPWAASPWVWVIRFRRLEVTP